MAWLHSPSGADSTACPGQEGRRSCVRNGINSRSGSEDLGKPARATQCNTGGGDAASRPRCNSMAGLSLPPPRRENRVVKYEFIVGHARIPWYRIPFARRCGKREL